MLPGFLGAHAGRGAALHRLALVASLATFFGAIPADPVVAGTSGGGIPIDREGGHFRERGMAVVHRVLASLTETPEKIAEGLDVFRTLVRRGGVTTVADRIAGSTIGIDVVLDVLTQLRRAHPRDDFRFSLEHFGVSREDQVDRLARLGASVSANGYYLHSFADRYARHGLGEARASQITRLGSLARAGVRFAMHSDCPMGPIEPLRAVAAAVTRRTAEGRSMAPGQAVSVEAALRAVTIDAAWNLRLDGEVGSIAPGKRADFVALDRSPRDVRPDRIADIEIVGTFYEGRPFETP